MGPVRPRTKHLADNSHICLLRWRRLRHRLNKAFQCTWHQEKKIKVSNETRPTTVILVTLLPFQTLHVNICGVADRYVCTRIQRTTSFFTWRNWSGWSVTLMAWYKYVTCYILTIIPRQSKQFRQHHAIACCTICSTRTWLTIRQRICIKTTFIVWLAFALTW